MENFILDRFGATIKLTLYLCMIVIFIVKSMQFYMKQHEFWSMQVKLLYILFISLYLGGNIVIIGGVTGTLTMNWGSIAVCMIIIGTIVLGYFCLNIEKTLCNALFNTRIREIWVCGKRSLDRRYWVNGYCINNVSMLVKKILTDKEKEVRLLYREVKK